VNWYAWTDDAWSKAKDENKLVLVSIGYSSCHWCHVMEHETFEDVDAAKLMNDHFICIKVDREERPDVDHVYMSAVQLMTGHGGWPLNCICLPDGRPVYGGTYFQNAQWKSVLTQIHDFYMKDPEKTHAYANELTHGISQMEMVSVNNTAVQFSRETLKSVVENWEKHFDHDEGGPNRAPKFPMPNNYEFLLQYAFSENDDSLKTYVLLTLDKMAFGGIYDQVGGGFARYSTDALWKVPHFEKMLYDNAQLVSLYSHAYQLTKKELFKQVVAGTLEFIEREMTSAEGGFYAALDADSEGEEGKFYVWKKEELEKLFSEEEFKIASDYFNLNQQGYWEHGNYIPLRKDPDEVIASRHNLSEGKLKETIARLKKVLLHERNKRIRPGLDNKQLTSWNSLMIKAYCDAYEAFGENKFLESAERAATLLMTGRKKDGSLSHVIPQFESSPSPVREETGRSSAFLEDYSFTIEAFIKLYETTFIEKYLEDARQLANDALEHFFDPETSMFFFTSDLDARLIARKKEIHDNVIPASNSSMARSLFLLGKYFDEKKYLDISLAMLHNIQNEMARYGSSYSNWCGLMLCNVFPFYEVAIAGKDAEEKRKELSANYLPNKILAGTANGKSKLPLLKNRFVENNTLIYVCENYACKLPVEEVNQVLRII